MPLVRLLLCAQGMHIWAAPTLAQGDGWAATMRPIARKGRCFVIDVNPSCTSIKFSPICCIASAYGAPVQRGPRVEPCDRILVLPDGAMLAAPA